MNQDLLNQKDYWDGQVSDFDSIYAHNKSRFDNWIDATFRWDIYARYDYAMEHSEPIQGRAFLDVGCATGRYALEFARRGASRVVGIDISEKMLTVCNQRARLEHLEDRCAFVHTDLTQYQPDAQFDVCTGIGLFDYIRDAGPVLSKMRNVVSDRAIMSFPRFWTWRAPIRKVRLALRQCDVYFYTQEHIDALLKQAGFKRYELKQVGQLYCVVAFV